MTVLLRIENTRFRSKVQSSDDVLRIDPSEIFRVAEECQHEILSSLRIKEKGLRYFQLQYTWSNPKSAMA